MLPPVVLGYAAAADYLDLPSANALRQMVCRGKAPPSIKFGPRSRRFRVADIDRWLADKANVTQAEVPPPPRASDQSRNDSTVIEVIQLRSASSVRSGW
jgi:hypothetical protein